jgi:hypothetical protein
MLMIVLYSPDDLPAWLAGERHHHVVKAETVREWREAIDSPWVPYGPIWGDVEWDHDVLTNPELLRERVVPVVPPALETVECPTCDGLGRVKSRIGNHPYCPTCDGKGQVTRLAVGHIERRTVVAYQLVGVEKLPVVGYDAKRVMPPCVVEIRTIERTLFDLVAADGTEHNVTDEPWAAGLAPGDLVIRWRAIRVLDEPIIDQACRHGSFSPHYAEACDDSGRVPLVLTPGLCEVSIPEERV